jgi:hypothetical protein
VLWSLVPRPPYRIPEALPSATARDACRKWRQGECADAVGEVDVVFEIEELLKLSRHRLRAIAVPVRGLSAVGDDELPEEFLAQYRFSLGGKVEAPARHLAQRRGEHRSLEWLQAEAAGQDVGIEQVQVLRETRVLGAQHLRPTLVGRAGSAESQAPHPALCRNLCPGFPPLLFTEKPGCWTGDSSFHRNGTLVPVCRKSLKTARPGAPLRKSRRTTGLLMM